MILCKYTKLRSAAFMPHMDSVRAFGMAIRRTGVDIAFSQGFNNHMLLYFSQPIPLGCESIAEYFCADSAQNPKDFMDKLNNSLPAGFEILGTALTDFNPNIAAKITHARYNFGYENKDLIKINADDIKSRKEIIIDYKSKGEYVSKDFRGSIADVSTVGESLSAVLCCGNNNLRPDRFAGFLEKEYGPIEKNVRCIKTDAFILGDDGVLRNVDEVFLIK